MAQTRCISQRETALRETLRTHPADFDASIELAHSLLNEGRIWEAVAFANNAAEVRPNEPKGWDLLGTALTEMSPVSGEQHLRRALDLTPSNVNIFAVRDWPLKCRLAQNLKRQGRFVEARELYVSTPILEKPHRNGLWALREWAEMEEMDGRFADAIEILGLIRNIDPGNDDPLVFGSRILRRQGGLWSLDLDRACDLTPYAMSEKGKLYDLDGRHNEAWDCWERGKAKAIDATGYEYQDKVVADLFRELRAFPWDMMRPAATVPGPQPIFITGFMRSGTTLAEQILTSHPAISPGGELQSMNNAIELSDAILGRPGNFLDALANGGSIEALRDFYLTDAREACRPTGPWFTDKMPLNEVYAPLIRLMFPKSPIIRMIRHPLDVMVSAFSHHANHGHYCALRLETLALHYKRVDELFDSDQYSLYQTEYENVVKSGIYDAKSSRELHWLFHSIGLSPKDVTDHTQNTRVPLTPSHEQVKQPLYTTSIGRWQNYRRQLQPAIDILGTTIERLGYKL